MSHGAGKKVLHTADADNQDLVRRFPIPFYTGTMLDAIIFAPAVWQVTRRLETFDAEQNQNPPPSYRPITKACTSISLIPIAEHSTHPVRFSRTPS
ncbi:MAG: hypothetical protein VX679_07865 [Pseudomonadota bacterium]|nr:hypothetical protein [Pseudomonadota bacterium]